MALVPSVCSRIGHSAQTVHAGALCSSCFVQRYLVCHIGLHCVFLAALSSKSYTQCLTIRPSGRLRRRLTQALGLNQSMQQYATNWSDYRRRQWLAALVPVVLAPVAALGAATNNEMLSLASAAVWVSCTFAAWSWFIWFRCPNCGKRFHITPILNLSLGRKCPHCGLARYASA
jgi:hypothetical protein